jgi:hypothetical protein
LKERKPWGSKTIHKANSIQENKSGIKIYIKVILLKVVICFSLAILLSGYLKFYLEIFVDIKSKVYCCFYKFLLMEVYPRKIQGV